jgi:hypothetical protein
MPIFTGISGCERYSCGGSIRATTYAKAGGVPRRHSGGQRLTDKRATETDCQTIDGGSKGQVELECEAVEYRIGNLTSSAALIGSHILSRHDRADQGPPRRSRLGLVSLLNTSRNGRLRRVPAVAARPGEGLITI